MRFEGYVDSDLAMSAVLRAHEAECAIDEMRLLVELVPSE